MKMEAGALCKNLIKEVSFEYADVKVDSQQALFYLKG